MNAVIAAVGIMLVLSLCRVHVVVALIIGALAGGLLGGLGVEGTLQAFNQGLGGGATVALSYALLGAFAVAIAKSGLAHALRILRGVEGVGRVTFSANDVRRHALVSRIIKAYDQDTKHARDD